MCQTTTKERAGIGHLRGSKFQRAAACELSGCGGCRMHVHGGSSQLRNPPSMDLSESDGGLDGILLRHKMKDWLQLW
jgi:ferredoxin